VLRKINGIWYESKVAEDEWHLRTYHLGNGHAESVLSRPLIWTEVPTHLQERFDSDWEEIWNRPRTEAEEADRRERNRKRAARRATTRIRRLVKVMGLNALFTLTYKANQTDLALCKRHLKEFVRRARRVLPGMRYVAAFEQQKRGAWHVHLVTDALPRLLKHHGAKVKSYNVMRAIWRSVVGDLGGNFDQARKVRASRQSCAKLAAYVSKYMMKAFAEGDDWSNRYSSSEEGAKIPPPVLLTFRNAALAELIDLTFSEIAVGDREVTMWLSRWGDVFYLSTEGLGAPFDLSAHCR
jgi:hypothetical protein